MASSAMATSAMATAAAISGKGVFTASIVAGSACVASPIPRLICLEVVEALRSARRHRSMVTVARIETVVDVAVKAVRAVKPGSGAKKYASDEPIGPVIAIGSAVIRLVVEIAVGAHRLHSNVDGNLGSYFWCAAGQGNCEGCESKNFSLGHNISLLGLEPQREWRVVSTAQIHPGN